MQKIVLLCFFFLVLGPLLFALDGKVEDVRGVHSKLERNKQISALQKGLVLYENDTVRNGDATISKLSLAMQKPKAIGITVFPESTFHVQEKFVKADDKPWHLKLFSGFLRVHVREKMNDQGSASFVIETPDTVIGVRGTDFTCERVLENDVSRTEKLLGEEKDKWDDTKKWRDAVCVLSGVVYLSLKGTEHILKAGQCRIRGQIVPMVPAKFEKVLDHYEDSIAGGDIPGLGDDEIKSIEIPKDPTEENENLHRDREKDQRRIPSESSGPVLF